MRVRDIPIGTVLLAALIFLAMVLALWGVPWIEETFGGKGTSYSTAAPWGN